MLVPGERDGEPLRRGKAEHPLDFAERALDLGADLGLRAVRAALYLIDHTAVTIAVAGEILVIGRVPRITAVWARPDGVRGFDG
jgi:hypothetical protein